MKLNKRIILVALAAAIAAPGAVFAAKSDKKKEKGSAPTFASCDKNNDGKVTKEEFVAAVKAAGGNEKGADKQFAAKDKNSDGNLSSEEFNARAKKKKA